MIKTLIALPYELARWPFAFLDRTIADKVPEVFGPRVALDRAIGSADQVAGAVLHNRDIAQRGADRIAHSDTVLAAVRLEGLADTRRAEARETSEAGQQEAAEKRQAAQDRAAGGLAEADRAEAAGKQAATAAAAATAQAKKTAAKKRAAGRAAAAEQREAATAATARAEKERTQGAAKAEIDEARAAKKTAAADRAAAERLDELAARKKRKRTDG